MVQWLRVHTLNAGPRLVIPSQVTRSQMPQLKDLCAVPASNNKKKSHVPQLRPSGSQINIFYFKKIMGWGQRSAVKVKMRVMVMARGWGGLLSPGQVAGHSRTRFWPGGSRELRVADPQPGSFSMLGASPGRGVSGPANPGHHRVSWPEGISRAIFDLCRPGTQRWGPGSFWVEGLGSGRTWAVEGIILVQES